MPGTPETTQRWKEAVGESLPSAQVSGILRCRERRQLSLTREMLIPAIQAVSPGEDIVVIINDQTRKTGASDILPLLLDAWQRERGIDLAAVRIVVACGSHRGPTDGELCTILGDALAQEFRGRIHIHNAFDSDCVPLGTTQRGTPVAVNRVVAEADAVVPIGGVLFHYFAGFSGGPKSIVPGVAAASTIAANHSLTVDASAGALNPAVSIGRLQGNPVAEDLAEAVALCMPRTSVQTVVDSAGCLIGCFAGELFKAHADARDSVRATFGVPLEALADVVVADAGPARNWVQSHKALVNASRAVKPTGVIALNAPCPEGLGSESIKHWLEIGDPAKIVAGIQETADINSQTALSTLVRGKRAVLLTEMPADTVAMMRMARAESMADALGQARKRLERSGRRGPFSVVLMPEAWLTVPRVGGNADADG